MKQYPDYDLSSHNTFGMKVRCALFIDIMAEEELAALDLSSLPQPVFVMGGGSNLLFSGDFPGTVLHVGITDVGAEEEVRGHVHPRTWAGGGARWPQVPAERKNAVDNGRGRSEGSERSSSDLFLRSKDDNTFDITLGAGVVFDDFCARAASEGLWGPENLSLIPGEVGASAVQNIGAYGVEAKDIITGIRAWDRPEGRFVDIDPADCAYGYRTSRFKKEWKGRYIITAVSYRLSRVPRPKLDYGGVRKVLEARFSETEAEPTASMENLTPQDIRDTIIGIRRQKLPDPEEVGSAGSFFCNPVVPEDHFRRIVAIAQETNGPDYVVPHYRVDGGIKVPAAWMIEQCGFKGMRLGGAQVYPKQPLVIVNATGAATPAEVIALRDRIIDTIHRRYGVTLHPEVELV